VTGAGQATAAASSMAMQVNNASNFVLGHTGESYSGPAGPSEINNFTSRHGSGCSFVYADAHVAFLGTAVDYVVYKALSTRANGEVIGGER
jgi:prepilin-type processing-associated H-X9-DG protein